MRLNLHLTHWSLLFITLISSCFLFYVVASENAKYVTTKHAAAADMASNAAVTPPPPSAPTSPEIAINSVNDADSIDSANQPKENRKDKTVNILPNYKKIKKLQVPMTGSHAPSLELQFNDEVEQGLEVNSPSSHIVVDGDSNDDLKNSDSVIDVNDKDSILENNIVLNTNDDSFVAAERIGSGGEHDDNIHSAPAEENDARAYNMENVVNEKPQQKQLEKPDVVDIKTSHHDVGAASDSFDDNDDNEKSLPDITDIPTVTITELPLEILQPVQSSVDSVIINGDIVERGSDDKLVVNRTLDIVVNNEGEVQKDAEIVKINDSGGGIIESGTTVTSTINLETQESATASSTSPSASINIPNDLSTNATQEAPALSDTDTEQQNASTTTSSSSSPSTIPAASQANLTAEEVPMPVFSEWAQKQMEAAEKEALEQEQTFNNSAQRKNNTNGNGKPPTLKIRAKNYASPDCGAKIIASSAYTSNPGAVLSSSKDEYMLSTCGNRIWVVVELCEAIQAQKIDFANFELYSSSPQNFTVAVSKRFPTRDWSNVGRFVAEDKRAVQSFDLHPHLFGKFVRVDIHSHYSKEHFCTLSLFRVFGTSEFEAFETENHPNDDLEDFDDEEEQTNVKNSEPNLFKSASDAVLSIVKKATELVGKPSNNQNHTFKTPPHTMFCRTPMFGSFSCAECSSALVERVNNALSCEFSHLNSLLNVAAIRNDLLKTQVCTKWYGIETQQQLTKLKDVKQSFYVNILPNAYVAALCQLLARPKIPERPVINETEPKEPAEISNNQTIDKKFGKEDLERLENPETKLIKPELPIVKEEKTDEVISPETTETSTEVPLDDNQQQVPRPLESAEEIEVTTAIPKIVETPSIPDKNIFNVPAEDKPATETELSKESQETPTTSNEINVEQLAVPTTPPTISATITTTPPPPAPKLDVIPGNVVALPAANTKSEEDSWDNIESLLTSTPASTVPSGGSIVFPQTNGPGGTAKSNGPQSESVFIRLSNRIKALERNMSLSGQYLEELSRRYKKQVEELQQTLTQQIQTVRTLEEQNRRHHELEELYAQRNSQLKHELDDLTLQVHACIVVIIFVGAFVFLVLMVAILFYRSLRRDTKEVLALCGRERKNRTAVNSAISLQKKLNRRKSFEDFSDHQQSIQRLEVKNHSNSEKLRRPSEEAMLILKDSKSDGKIVVGQLKASAENEAEVASNNGAGAGRQRKISVCYGSNNNINGSTESPAPLLQSQKSIASGGRRKGEKHSWPNTVHAQMQALQHLEQLNSEAANEGSLEVSATKTKKSTLFNGQQPLNVKSKKKKDFFRRQESSPPENINPLNKTAPADLNSTSDYDEKLMLDEDDLDNFIPNADLAYNEFMPDGPRGYQCLATQANANNAASKKSDGNGKKSRRLSSPVFFKSPFTKSLKGKITSSKSNPPHESTSWEWYRLRKSASANSPNSHAASSTTTTTNAYLRVSPNASLDSSSLSEINFPTNSTENSFRILEEAILSSGESAITTTTTGSSSINGNNRSGSHRTAAGSGGSGGGGGSGLGMLMMGSGISSSSNSNRSSSSNSSTTQSKKKNRSFNKIFRKVF